MEDYEIVPQEQVVATKVLAEMWEKLGKPDTPLSKNGGKLMDILIATWEDLFPVERTRWLKERKEYQDHEMTPKQQVKHRTGRSLASYPMYIYKMMKQIFPNFDPVKRENCFKLVKRWPMFKFAKEV